MHCEILHKYVILEKVDHLTSLNGITNSENECAHLLNNMEHERLLLRK